MSTLLKDVIAIPTRTGAEDYVLRLTEGVSDEHLARTIQEYVVTENLTEAFDQSLDLVADALKKRTSRAAFLAGSFGSGKSHFMAVLHGLLGEHPAARAKTELQGVVAAHDPDLQGKKILRLAFHFLDAKTMESCILGGYIDQMRRLHPEAPLPAVHQTDALLANADELRARMGDTTFFEGLGGAAAPASPWGNVLGGSAWDAERYDAARAAAPGEPERNALVDALVRSYLSSFAETEDFVDLDTGLARITDHAKALGYDAVVMFLDELVLWLSFHVRNTDLFGRETQKITKLVEGQHSRSIPLVTFVARQFDLRRYFSDSSDALGADQQSLDQAFRHQEGRFASIELGDTNLPFVAQQRLLRPVDAAAAKVLQNAFDRLDVTPEVRDVLLDGAVAGHRGSDIAAFRRTYPFSPALVDTLRTLASAMQRDRTALKVMQQLLVSQREHLTVDDVIPVGDTFDLVINGSHAITPEMHNRFRNAKQLYEQKVQPLLLREHGLASADLPGIDLKHPYRADDRLMKTLLLSAIAPEVPALKELTAARLAALNHGSIVSPLQGREASIVLDKMRRWSVEIPEIHVGDDAKNPVIRIRISEVDYESVINKVRGEDNQGRRQQLVKRMVFEQLGLGSVAEDVAGVTRHVRVWRGSKREIEVVFGNVRDTTWLPDSAFEASKGTWRVVIDFPFDESGRSVRDDDQRVESLAERGPSTTVVWLPHHLASTLRNDLGRLVILDWLLSGPGDRWEHASSDLPTADRPQAKSILENQLTALQGKLRQVIKEAYGAANANPDHLEIDEAHTRVVQSLYPEFAPGALVGADLGAAFSHLVDQAFAALYPGHPDVENGGSEVTAAQLERVLDAVEAAHQEADGIVRIDTADRATLRRIAPAFRLATMGEDRFRFGSETFWWRTTFASGMGAEGLGDESDITVGQARKWIEGVTPAQGLKPEVQDLIIAAWATAEGRTWFRYGAAIPRPKLGALTDDIVMRPVPLPSIEAWNSARKRAASIFGIATPEYLNGSNAAELAKALGERAAALQGHARDVVEQLEDAFSRLSVPPSGRYATAVAAAELLAQLRGAHDAVGCIDVLAAADLPSSDEAAARSLSTAESLVAALSHYDWARLQPLTAAEVGTGERAAAARQSLDKLRNALQSDEIVSGLANALKSAEAEAFTWMQQAVSPIEPALEPAPVPLAPTSPVAATQRRAIRSRAELTQVEELLREFVEQHGGAIIEWRATE